ncbi:hypothetical protein MNBD_ALPHA08-677 [hydrothermal vent metagenome]|uniref:Tetratricopeptide repeat protein n=1 Tax=hydrothermal vent metagenome TaxID=652676 RepID=A0A3B0S5K7_9ZZZZ
MSAKIPITRPVSIFGVVVLALIVSIVVFLGIVMGKAFLPEPGLLWGLAAAVFLIGFYMAFVHLFVLADFNKGLRLLLAEKNLEEATSLFERFLLLLGRRRWIDRWRFLVLLSPAAITYREMSLVNIAYCYAHLGEREKSKAQYEQTLEQFPDSAIASSALKMIKTFSQAKNEKVK